MDKEIGVFVLGMAIGGFLMVLADAYDNIKERNAIMKTIKTTSFRNYPYRTILFNAVEEVELVDTVCTQIFTEEFAIDVMFFDYFALVAYIPESMTHVIIQGLQNYAGDGLLIHKCITRIVKS